MELVFPLLPIMFGNGFGAGMGLPNIKNPVINSKLICAGQGTELNIEINLEGGEKDDYQG